MKAIDGGAATSKNIAYLQSEGFKSAQCLGNQTGSWLSFKIRTVRPTAEWRVQSLNLDPRDWVVPFVTYLDVKAKASDSILSTEEQSEEESEAQGKKVSPTRQRGLEIH